VDIVVKGRRTALPDRFRELAEEKMAKLEKFDHKIIRVEVTVTKEPNPRMASESDRVEVTVFSKGPVMRGEAAASDMFAALDLAADKLLTRVRKAHDRRREHRGNHRPSPAPTAAMPVNGSSPSGQFAKTPGAAEREDAGIGELASDEIYFNGPMVVREKTHEAKPIELDQALYEMELVGHDFYLFVDAKTQLPSVVYRRRGYDYGVIHLDV
jgi:ribosomal subunit interface protein